MWLNIVVNLTVFLFNWVQQTLGIRGKMFAKKNYAEKAQMKKTWVFFCCLFILLLLQAAPLNLFV
jgi:hypothetical protein